MPEVTGTDYIYKTTEEDKTETQTPPENEENGARSGETASQGAIGREDTQTARPGEEEQKHQVSDLVTVWVQTNRADRPKFEEATLLDCEGEGFSVSIKGEVWLIPCEDLLWQPPEPS